MKIACDCCRDGYVDFSLLIPRGAGPGAIIPDIALRCQVCHGTGEVDAEERIARLKKELKHWRVLAVQQSWEGEVFCGERNNMLLNTDILIYGSDMPSVREFAYSFDEDASHDPWNGRLDESNLKR